MATKKKAKKPKPSPQAKKASRKAKPVQAQKKQSQPAKATTKTKTAVESRPTPSRSTIRSSLRPSGALSRSTLQPSGASPTNGGTRYLTVQDLVDLHRAVSIEFGGTQSHPGVVESQFGLINAVQRPQVPTAKKARATSRGKDAISLLMKDHEKVRGLLKKLENAADRGDDRAVDLLAQVDREVKIHSQVEEEIFYPAFKEAARTKEENKLFYEAEEEHHVVDLVMPEVHDSEGGGEDFAAKTKVLKDLIEHHAEEEE